MAKYKLKFDRNRKQEPELPIGTSVVVQRKKKNGKTGRWDMTGTIVSKRSKGNSYMVDIDGYNHFDEYLCSRLFLRPAPTPSSKSDDVGDPSQADTSEPELRRSERIGKNNRRKNSKSA